MKTLTYRILMIILLILGLSQTSFAQDLGMDFFQPPIAGDQRDFEDRGYLDEKDTDSPLYGGNEADPFFDDEPDYPSEIGPDYDAIEDTIRQSGVYANNCRGGNARDLTLSYAERAFIDLNERKLELLEIPLLQRTDQDARLFRQLTSNQRLINRRCGDMNSLAPNSLSLTFEHPVNLPEKNHDDGAPLIVNPDLDGDLPFNPDNEIDKEFERKIPDEYIPQREDTPTVEA